MLAAEADNYLFQRPKRAVAIRRDGDDFVVPLMPNDLVIFRNESAAALRKLCKGLRWAVVSDTAIASPFSFVTTSPESRTRSTPRSGS
jgi:hypothetical protein